MSLQEFITDSSIVPAEETLWQAAYKIPWNEPGFSERMLREHLTQKHDLASRKHEMLLRQCAWLHQRHALNETASILDLGCGPGLYAPLLSNKGAGYTGIDFGPASIAHAQEHYGGADNVDFIQGDILDADFGKNNDLIIQIYGEINVFPPVQVARIFGKCFAALKPGGVYSVEMQTAEAVKQLGAAHGWTAAATGLFLPGPHLCLTQGHWYERSQTALQLFHAVDARSGDVQSYRSTNKAWSTEALMTELAGAGFTDITLERDWPSGNEGLQLISARRP